MKLSLHIVILLWALCMPAHAMNQSMRYEYAGVYYTTNRFGDIFIQWQDIPLESLTEKLTTFVDQLKHQLPRTPFIIQVPHEKGAALAAIKKANFCLFDATNEQTEWIIKNNSSIPAPHTSVLAAAVIIIRDTSMLLVEEKTRLGQLGVPGGSAEFQEFVRDAAAREIIEELNLALDPDDLLFFAIENQIHVNRFNANHVNYYFIIDASKVGGTLNPCPHEIAQAFYVPLEDVAAQKTINGLTIAPFVAALAAHLLEKITDQAKKPSAHTNKPPFEQIFSGGSKYPMSIEFV